MTPPYTPFPPCLAPAPDNSTYLTVHLCPRAAKNAIQGLHGTSLKIRLCAPPVDGAANKALCKYLADLFQIPSSRVTLIAGQTSREKRLLLASLPPSSAAALLPPL